MVVPIAMVGRWMRLEWLGYVNRRYETENVRTVVEIKMVEAPLMKT